jgi:hypothetical protein
MAGSIFIPLISVFDSKGIRDAKAGMTALGGVVKNLKGMAKGASAAFGVAQLKSFVKESVVSARDLDRNMVGLGNVFGELSPQMQQFGKDAASIGLSQVEASRASTFLGSVLKQSGFEMKDVAVETKNLVGLASDLAATYGYDVSEALTGMTALFRGEYDPIEKFGVAMKQSEVNALLAARGQNKLTGATLRQATAQARLDILYQRSTDAQGAYAQQSNTLFTNQKNLAASFENVKATLGASLTGPLANLLASITPIVEVLGARLGPAFEFFAKIVNTLSPLVAPLIEVFLTLSDALQPILDVLIMLIEPLIVPLAGALKLVGTIIKPLIPLITFLANLIGAVLSPVILLVNLALRLLIGGLQALFDALARVPGLGDIFNNMNAGLKEFSTNVLSGSGATDNLSTSVDEMTAKLSKKIPTNSIDNIGGAADKAKTKINKTGEALNDLIQNAKSVQSSIISSFDVNNAFGTITSEIVRSVVYVDGKFKAVVSGIKTTNTDIAAGFANSFTKIKTFYKNLKTLDKLGLDDTLISQIIGAGPESGNATAEAIIASGKEGISGLNKTAKGIKKVAGDIGVLGAKAMENAGKQLGNGLIDGLMSQQAKIIAAVEAIGTSVGTAVAESASAAVKRIMAEAKAAGFNLTETDLLKIDPNYKPKSTKQPFYSNMSSLFKPKTLKPDAKGMYSFKPTSIKNTYDPNISAEYVKFWQIEQAKAKAVTYNLNVTVPYGATDAEIGRVLIKQLQAYERTNGTTWRGPKQ